MKQAYTSFRMQEGCYSTMQMLWTPPDEILITFRCISDFMSFGVCDTVSRP